LVIGRAFRIGNGPTKAGRPDLRINRHGDALILEGRYNTA